MRNSWQGNIALNLWIWNGVKTGARGVMNSVNSLVGGISRRFDGMRAAIAAAAETGVLSRMLYATAGLMYGLTRAIGEATRELELNQAAMRQAEHWTVMYGRSVAGTRQQIDRLALATTGMSDTAAAAAVGNLTKGRFSRQFIEEFTPMFENVALAMGAPVSDTVARITSDLAHGSAGILGEQIPHLEAQMAMFHQQFGNLADPWKNPVARQVLESILRQYTDHFERQGNVARRTLYGVREELTATVTNLQLTFGQALEPLLIALTRAVLHIANGILTFTRAHPDLVRIITVTVGIAAAMSSLALAIGGVSLAYRRMAASQALGAFARARMPVMMPALPATAFGNATAVGIMLRGLIPMFTSVMVLLAVFGVMWRKNFLGTADVVTSWWTSLKLVFTGVYDAMTHLTDLGYSFSNKNHAALEEAGLLTFVRTLVNWLIIAKTTVQAFWHGLTYGLLPLMLVIRFIIKLADMFFIAIGVIDDTHSSMDNLYRVMVVVGIAVGLLIAKFAIAGILMALPFVIIAAKIALIIGLLYILYKLFTNPFEGIKLLINGIGMAVYGMIALIMQGVAIVMREIAKLPFVDEEKWNGWAAGVDEEAVRVAGTRIIGPHAYYGANEPTTRAQDEKSEEELRGGWGKTAGGIMNSIFPSVSLILEGVNLVRGIDHQNERDAARKWGTEQPGTATVR